ncbi:Predicted permease [Malonomonas rubra DSM 5091]|uniref:Predicted permease n=1 Tax=Malonomonas rubra DSM 5091 TaxID=1122189 RepID=A0A1M6HDP7_MALRU|nr:permease [Malonomonas rubra]SHJ20289.1 Predicted permease [Malonomonas rubra DSM 5091]
MMNMVRTQWLLLFTVNLYLYAFSVAPERAANALSIGANTLGSVVLLICSVFGLVGLLQTWISRDLIVRLLGREGGVKGLVIATICGTVLIGPAYIIFPLLMSIQKQGARWAVITIVLTSYAVKVQMIPVEVGFLGWPFSLARAVITIGLAIPTGLIVEAFMERRKL